MMNIIEYCKNNKIKTLPINLVVTDKGKKYLDKDEGRFQDGRYNFKITDFKKHSLKECQAFMENYGDETEWIGIDTSIIQQLDIDDVTGKFWLPQTQENIEKSEYPSPTLKEYEDVPHYLSVKKKMPHYFVKTDLKSKKCTEVPFDHDVLYEGCWGWAQKDQTVMFCGCEIPQVNLTKKEISSGELSDFKARKRSFSARLFSAVASRHSSVSQGCVLLCILIFRFGMYFFAVSTIISVSSSAFWLTVPPSRNRQDSFFKAFLRPGQFALLKTQTSRFISIVLGASKAISTNTARWSETLVNTLAVDSWHRCKDEMQ